MGSGGSKDAGGVAAGSGGKRSRRWLRAGVLGSSCFRLPSSAAAASDYDQHENGREGLPSNVCEVETSIKSFETSIKSHRRRKAGCLKFKRVPQPPQATCSTSSCSGFDADCQAQDSTCHARLGDSSSSSTQAAAITLTSNSLSRSHSHFGFISDGIASRLDRAASLGSSDAYSTFPASYSTQNPEGDDHVHKDSSTSSDSGDGMQQGTTAVDNVSSQSTDRSITDTAAAVSGCSHRNLARTENFERRPSRRHRPQEHLEGSIRFSRTLSVGRLRDRVLRGPSFSDRLFGPGSLGDRLVEYHGNDIGRRALNQARIGVVSSDNGTNVFSTSNPSNPASVPSSMDNSHGSASEILQLREVTNGDILEHRSAFIERRRRIRSQVQALQQLGSRVDNFPGHDRSCILSGRHRTGRCTCRTNGRPANRDDGRSARSSISRIVMLAEALFEVLDEIHQQAVVLASRPTVPSIGSVPAPKEIVEHMPLRIYEKPQKHHNEETAQCYICLVEYEDGDYVRILPCHHEFHRTCVDKWLKEIHRVCPLCRGDVCVSDLPPIS